MTRQELVDQVNAVMQEEFEVPTDRLVPSAKLFEDLGFDSLDAIDLLVHLEERLKVKVDAERLSNVRTVQDVYDLVLSLAG